MWRPWLRSLTDRTLDVVDIQFLSYVKNQRMDFRWKQLVCDLSQNIDRQGRTKFGLTGCLTPSGILLLTNRGGPVIGLETLKLQGLPVEDLLLTRESMQQLQDFAGNAMTSTVVGASILSGFLTSPDAFAPRTSSSSKMDLENDEHSIVVNDTVLTRCKESTDISFTSLQDLLSKAHKSARRCETEGHHRLCDKVRGVRIISLNVSVYTRILLEHRYSSVQIVDTPWMHHLRVNRVITLSRQNLLRNV